MPIRLRRAPILFVTKPLAYGGTEKHLAALITRLVARRVDPVIVCFGQDWYSRCLNERQGLAVTIVGATDPGTFVGYWRAFVRWRAPVVVFVNGQHGLFPWSAYVAARLAGARRLIAIEQLLGEPAPEVPEYQGARGVLRRLGGWRSKYMLSMRTPGYVCDTTICVSDAVRERLVREYGYPEKRTVRIWNPVDLTRFGPYGHPRPDVRGELGIGLDEELLVCVASLNPLKRIDILLEAMAIVAASPVRCRCLIVGSGRLEDELRRMAAALGLSSSVLFVGQVDDVRPYLEAADLYVTASEREGLPLAVAEAMACGLPCVATDIGGHNEIVVAGHTGLLVRPGSAGELAEAIQYLLAHREERRAMGLAGRKRVEEHFDMGEAMARIQAVLLD